MKLHSLTSFTRIQEDLRDLRVVYWDTLRYTQILQLHLMNQSCVVVVIGPLQPAWTLLGRQYRESRDADRLKWSVPLGMPPPHHDWQT